MTALAPEIRALLDRMAASGRPPLERQSVAQARAFHVQDAAALGGEPVPVATVDDRRIPGPAGELPVRVYTPEGEAPFPIVVFFHGGGWVVGTLDSYDPLCRALAAATPAVVVSVDYRTIPEDPFPAGPGQPGGHGRRLCVLLPLPALLDVEGGQRLVHAQFCGVRRCHDPIVA